MAITSLMQFERALLAWPLLTQRAGQRRTITYKELGDALNVHHRAVRYFLALIQDYCINSRLPPLTILIVNGTGLPGTGFIARDFDDIEEGLKEVYEYDWNSEANPFGDDEGSIDSVRIVNKLIDYPHESGEIYSQVRARGIAQILFREALLEAYNGKCAVTGISIHSTLQACHIIPWSQATSEQRLDVRNGLLLNCFHHHLFDSGMMTIDCDYNIVLADKLVQSASASALERTLTADIHGRKIHVPRKLIARPLREYLQIHYALQKWTDFLKG